MGEEGGELNLTLEAVAAVVVASSSSSSPPPPFPPPSLFLPRLPPPCCGDSDFDGGGAWIDGWMDGEGIRQYFSDRDETKRNEKSDW